MGCQNRLKWFLLVRQVVLAGELGVGSLKSIHHGFIRRIRGETDKREEKKEKRKPTRSIMENGDQEIA